MFQNNFLKGSLSAIALTAAIAYAPSGSATLVNSGFESPDASAGDTYCSDDWICFNNSFTTSNLYTPGGGFVNPTAHGGTQVLKQYGGDGGALQGGIAANAGDTVSASVYAMNWSGDEFNNLALLQIGYFDDSGGLISTDEVFADSLGNQDYHLTPQDGGELTDWTLMEVSGVAPEGTASAQILLLHILIDGTPNGGSIFWDDASLTVTAVPIPAAVWLFGSGLLGLVGVARRRKS